ncbi:class I SAM-dependent methyltransferase [Alkaliphilus hydrothermalis]|uniref:2-polyprenyl-3-methyl-5-hydroxy-6-metoxy-1, 4-benzoquinol methylase n=1 Tax=Alkaliphilus hydrothermalis TaxID=1482730 RepID=A0ABS2NQR2_9FIRM|nr:2-polyprenyl-3-methyl-5-hydroxy-6-metoxy-1,4-benzoquinol methylase [Alkaliphilus hydrothermalis]
MAFYEEFNKYYDYIFPTGKPQLQFISKRALGSKVLDIACGTGNYSIPLAEQGLDVSAVDLDEGMIRALRQKAEAKGVTIKAATGDMKLLKEYFQEGGFQTIFCIGNSLVHLTSIDEIQQVLQDIYSLLEEEGILVLQIVNYDRILKYNVDHLPTIDNEDVGVSLVRKYDYNPVEHLVYFNTELIFQEQQMKFQNSVSLYPLKSEELQQMLKKAGFKIEEQYGSFKEDCYNEEAYANIIVARK